MIHKNAAPSGVWQENKSLGLSQDKEEKPASSIEVTTPKPKKEKPKKAEPEAEKEVAEVAVEEAPKDDVELSVEEPVQEEAPSDAELDTDSL
jgi:hypothetical protein